MTEKYPKVYIHGAIGRQKDIENLFKTLNVNNPVDYKFGDPTVIYFINKHNNISIAEPGSELYDVIKNSSDWKELHLKTPKKEHKFLITLREGSSSCEGCEVKGRCNQKQQTKCQLAKCLNELNQDIELTGKVVNIVEVDDYHKPVTPYTKDDMG